METTKVGAYELQCEKNREFQYKLGSVLVHYCLSGGKDYWPTDEKLFLAAVVRGLSDVVGISGIMVEITPRCISRQHWGEDIEEAISNATQILMDDNNELPITLHNTFHALKELLVLERDSDQTGGREDKNILMTIFKNTRDSSGYYGKTWRTSPKIISETEKNLIPNLLVSNFGALNFIKILEEKTKKHLEKTLKQLEVEAKSYIDRE